MRPSAFAWICLVAALATACQTGAAGRSDSLASLAPAAYQEQHARVNQVASRLTVALADVCACPTEAHGQSPGTNLCGYPVRIETVAKLEASTNGQRVRITSGMLDYFDSDDELAFVLAHELSHILLGHAGGFNGLSSKEAEAEADRLGIQIVSAAHFDPERAAVFPLRLAASYPAMNSSAVYPMPAERTAKIRTALRADAGGPPRAGLQGACAD